MITTWSQYIEGVQNMTAQELTNECIALDNAREETDPSGVKESVVARIAVKRLLDLEKTGDQYKAGINYVLGRAVQDGCLSRVNDKHGVHIPDELYDELKAEGKVEPSETVAPWRDTNNPAIAYDHDKDYGLGGFRDRREMTKRKYGIDIDVRDPGNEHGRSYWIYWGSNKSFIEAHKKAVKMLKNLTFKELWLLWNFGRPIERLEAVDFCWN